VDLALLRSEDFLASELPALRPGFRFDAFLEFAYLGDSWTVPQSVKWGEPGKGRQRVVRDVEKCKRYLEKDACDSAYAIVFEECDFGFPKDFTEKAEASSGCKVRFVRGLRS
jgi:hypothetical protein